MNQIATLSFGTVWQGFPKNARLEVNFCISYSLLYILYILNQKQVFYGFQIQHKGEPKMKKTKLTQDDLERQIQDLLALYSDPLGCADFRKAWYICTRTSLCLLQTRLVPCKNTGKQTRCCKITYVNLSKIKGIGEHQSGTIRRNCFAIHSVIPYVCCALVLLKVKAVFRISKIRLLLWRRRWDSNPRAHLWTKRFRVVLVTTTSIRLLI